VCREWIGPATSRVDPDAAVAGRATGST